MEYKEITERASQKKEELISDSLENEDTQREEDKSHLATKSPPYLNINTENHNFFNFTFQNNNTEEKFDLFNSNLKYIIKEPLYEYRCLCLTKDNKIVSCSGDTSIKIYNLKAEKIQIIKDAHNFSINYISILSNQDIVSSSNDKTIKIWRLGEDTFERIKTLESHTGAVIKAIQISGGRICSCSFDKTIIIWDEKDFHLIKTLKGHTEFVQNVIELKSKDYLVSAGNLTIRFWDNQTYKCKQVIKGIDCSSPNSMVESQNNKLIVGGINGIVVINSATLDFELKVKENLKDVTSFFPLREKEILCGCNFNGKTGSIVKIGFGNFEYSICGEKTNIHDNCITSIAILNNYLITCSLDKTIKIFE